MGTEQRFMPAASDQTSLGKKNIVSINTPSGVLRAGESYEIISNGFAFTPALIYGGEAMPENNGGYFCIRWLLLFRGAWVL